MSGRALLLIVALLLGQVGTAAASEERPTVQELEGEVMCPTCKQLLALSSAPIADRMRAFIAERIEAGETKSEIKAKLVSEFGEGVLAAPPASGFNILAWALPIGGALVAGIVISILARRWARSRAAVAASDQAVNGRPRLDPELEQRVDDELARFDR